MCMRPIFLVVVSTHPSSTLNRESSIAIAPYLQKLWGLPLQQHRTHVDYWNSFAHSMMMINRIKKAIMAAVRARCWYILINEESESHVDLIFEELYDAPTDHFLQSASCTINISIRTLKLNHANMRRSCARHGCCCRRTVSLAFSICSRWPLRFLRISAPCSSVSKAIR